MPVATSERCSGRLRPDRRRRAPRRHRRRLRCHPVRPDRRPRLRRPPPRLEWGVPPTRSLGGGGPGIPPANLYEARRELLLRPGPP